MARTLFWVGEWGMRFGGMGNEISGIRGMWKGGDPILDCMGNGELGSEISGIREMGNNEDRLFLVGEWGMRFRECRVGFGKWEWGIGEWRIGKCARLPPSKIGGEWGMENGE